MISGRILLKTLLIIWSFLFLTAAEKVLATVPNLHVLLNDVLFMEVVSPESIRYSYKIRPAKNFGISFQQRYTNVELSIGEPYHGCSPLSNSHQIHNKIALLQRGECSFVTKSIHAETAGAIAVIIADNDLQNDQAFVDMVDDNTERFVSIPALFLLGKDGHMIKTTLERLGLHQAIINIPINMTGTTVHRVNQPPWTLW